MTEWGERKGDDIVFFSANACIHTIHIILFCTCVCYESNDDWRNGNKIKLKFSFGKFLYDMTRYEMMAFTRQIVKSCRWHFSTLAYAQRKRKKKRRQGARERERENNFEPENYISVCQKNLFLWFSSRKFSDYCCAAMWCTLCLSLYFGLSAFTILYQKFWCSLSHQYLSQNKREWETDTEK